MVAAETDGYHMETLYVQRAVTFQPFSEIMKIDDLQAHNVSHSVTGCFWFLFCLFFCNFLLDPLVQYTTK